MNQFLEQFTARGLLHQCTDLDSLGKLPKITAYIGFDCTASSLHVGSLMQIMILRLLKATGNTPIVLLGGGTTKVGDPSGKDESRKLLTEQDIEANKAGISKVFEKFGLGDCVIVDNNDWLKDLNYLEFLRDYGKHFSINRMMGFDSVKLRLEREQNLSFLEFNYMILQAYDFVELNRRHNCQLQIGGSDQWGNIVNGVELHRKLTAQPPNHPTAQPLYGLTTPLITTASGAKMGKTAAGAVWLDEALLSPYDYYQFWRNTEDADVIKFLNIFSELPAEEIAALAKLEGADINKAKKILAYEATKLCHGVIEAEKANAAATNAFELGTTGGLPEIILENRQYKIAELLVATGLSTSNGEAKRLVQGGGAKINDEKISDENALVQVTDGMKISSGKKKHVVLRLEN